MEPRAPISIVVASWAGEDRLRACLESLEPQWAAAEVLVPTNGPHEVTARLARRFPSVRFIQTPETTTVFRLRALGAAQATGRLVALIEDHVTVGPRWVEALCAAHRAGHGIVGGPVDNGLARTAYDWALFFCEYGIHMPPIAEGPVSALSGVNIAYDHGLLMSCRSRWDDTLQENEVNDALRVHGHRPYLTPRAWVATHLPMTLPKAMDHLFGGGRHFARYRASQSSSMKRFVWLALSPAVPLVLFGRIVRRVAARDPGRLRHVVRGAGYFALVLGAWSVGEACGYLDGLRAERPRIVER